MAYREYHYTVSGTGKFPVDMLRYGWCRPKGSEDSRKIELSHAHVRDAATINTPVEINLVGMIAPPIGRWHSFGWRLVGAVMQERIA